MDWNETKAIMLEVEQLFNRGDDLRDIQDIQKMQHEIEAHHANSLKDAKEIIKELTNHVAMKESEIMAPSEAIHAQQLEKIQNEKENINTQIQELREGIDKYREKTISLATDCLNARRQIVDLNEQNIVSETRTSYALTLYHKISGITWDTNEDELHPYQLSGTIANDEKKTIQPFHMNISTLSSYDIADQLWRLIEQQDIAI